MAHATFSVPIFLAEELTLSSKVTLRGNPVTVEGNLPTRGNQVPGLKLTNAAQADVAPADYGGNRKVLNIVPSMDTPISVTSTRKFNTFS